jgi:hypothetical protein
LQLVSQVAALLTLLGRFARSLALAEVQQAF